MQLLQSERQTLFLSWQGFVGSSGEPLHTRLRAVFLGLHGDEIADATLVT